MYYIDEQKGRCTLLKILLNKIYAFLLSLFSKAPEEIASEPQPSDSDLRCEESEARVFKVINEMVIWKQVPTRKKGVLPYRTEKWSELDMAGVDIVFPSKRGDIFVQVKSSETGRSKFIHRPRDKSSVYIICINGQLSEVAILNELRTQLRIAYERLDPNRPNDHA